MSYVVVTQTHCEYCQKAKDLLSKRQIKFTVCSIDHQGATELRRFLEGMRIRKVPAIFHNGNYVGGYDELKGYLDAGRSNY